MALPLAHLVCLLGLTAEPRPLPVIVTDLGSPDYGVREAATDALMRTGKFPLADIEKALKDPALTREQRARLELAGLQLFKEAPHGALGVQFTANPTVVEIQEVKKWFPASATLKAGDVITKLDGHPITSRTSFEQTMSVRALVISHDPGDEVPVEVLRNGKPLTLTVEFGDFMELNGDLPPRAPNAEPVQFRNPQISESEFEAAWQHRLARLTGRKAPAPINATVLRDGRNNEWSGGVPIDIIDAGAAFRAATGDAPSVAAGASPDQARQFKRANGIDDLDGPGRGGGFARFNVNNNNGFFIGRGFPSDPRELARMSDAELAAERQRLAQTELMYAQIAEQRGLNPADRKQFTDLQSQASRQRAAIVREIDRRKNARIDGEVEPVAPIAPPPPDVPSELKTGKP
jgi:hypothetical protein